MQRRTLLALILLAALGAAAGACKNAGLATASICDQACICEPCTDNDRQACEDAASQARKSAGELGCTSEFNAYLRCAEDHISCRDKDALDKECLTERIALNHCGKGLVPGSDPCRAANDLLSSCDISVGSPPSTCDGSSLCQANCVIASDCAELKDVYNGVQTSGPFVACTEACAQQGSTGSGGL